MRIDTTRRAALSASFIASSLPAFAVNVAEPNDAASALFADCVSRTPTSFISADERSRINSLIDELCALQAPVKTELLRGKWRLAYQSNIKHRYSPLAELIPTKENYQIIGRRDLIEVDELLPRGFLELRAAGSLGIIDTSGASAATRSFRASLTQGAICGSLTIGRREKANIGRLCAPLPTGRTPRQQFFDVQYADDRIRIGQTELVGIGIGPGRHGHRQHQPQTMVRTVHVRIRTFGGFA